MSDRVVLALTAGAVIFAFAVAKGMQDPDFFFHAATGRLIIEQGAVPSTDPFSFTWQGMPWTPHEWLGAVILYLLDEAVGPTGSTVVFGLLAGATVAIPVLLLPSVRVAAMAGPALVCGLAFVPYLTLRPQAFSWFLIALLVSGLFHLTPRRALLLIPLFVLWANLHGLYVIGLGIVAVYTVFTLLGRTLMPRLPMLGVALGCLAATTLTPAGLEGLVYPLRYLEPGDWGLANIQEWGSPDFHQPGHWLFLVIIGAFVALGTRGVPAWLATTALLGVLGGLWAMRGIPVGAVVAFPALSYALEGRLPELSLDPTRRWMTAAFAVLVAVATLVILVPKPLDAAVEGHRAGRFPLASVDILESRQPDARFFPQYYWGGYVAYRLHDHGGRVFVDGRNDMYDQSVLETYSAVLDARPGWMDVLRAFQVDAILIPPGRYPLEDAARGSGWCVAHLSDAELLLVPCSRG